MTEKRRTEAIRVRLGFGERVCAAGERKLTAEEKKETELGLEAFSFYIRVICKTVTFERG